MATELAKAYVGIIPSAEGITGNLAKVLEPEAESAGEKSGASLGGLLVSTLKGVLATAALGKALTDTLTEGGALEQSLGGVETLFKGNADTVKAYAQNAIVVALITGGLSLIGVIITNLAGQRRTEQRMATAQAVTDTKIEELTREVRAHNNFAQRVPVLEEQIKVANHRITDLENKTA